MKLDRIVLVGFIPFMSNDIARFDYTIKEALQIILGTNGCGKSKLFSELSPLPADTKMFNLGGKKVIYITHESKQYRLTSESMERKWVHSFYCITEDKEYNDGGTLRVQEELVESVFRYTKLVHRILTGRLEFTKLPFQMRKDIIILVSGLDLDYAMKLADAAHRGYRDVVGAYKHIKSKVSTLSLNAATDERIDALQNSWNATHDKYMKLKSFSSSLSHLERSDAIKTLEHQCEQQVTIIGRKYDKINELLTGIKETSDVTGKYETDSLLLGDIVDRLNVELGSTLNKTETLTKKLERMEEIKHKLEGVDLSGEESIFNEKINGLRTAKKNLAGKLEGTVRLTSTNSAKHIEDAVLALYALKENHELPKRIMTREECSGLIEAANDASERLSRLDIMLANENAVLQAKRITNESSVKCTNCGFVNAHEEGCTDKDIETQRALICDIESNFNKLKLEIEKEYNPKAKKAQDYFAAMRAIATAIGSNTTLEQIRAKVDMSLSEIAEKPDVLIGKLQQERVVLTHQLAYKETCEEIETLELYSELSSKGEMIQDDTLHDALADMNDKVEQLSSEKKRYTEYLTLLDEIESGTRELNEKAYRLYEMSLNNTLVDVSKSTDSQAAELEVNLMSISAELNNTRRERNLLEESQKDMYELDVKLNALGTLSKALDHKTGIIADSLRTVLESFCGDVNEYIGRVWDHELEVLPYQSDTLLNFKFPFKIKGVLNPEISEGSQGQHDIINFAVRLCLMDYLDISDYPTFMDEVGATFDSTHSDKLLSFTYSLASGDKGCQIFMISHYASEYGVYTNADFVVINDDNVIVPSVYNKHVKME